VAGPGGDEVGRVSIRVVPDTDGFRRRLESALDSAEAGLEVTIPVNFDVDTAGLRTQLEALELSSITIPVDLDLDTAAFRTRLEALENSHVTIPVDLDLRDEARINAVLARLNNRSIRINTRLNGVNQAIARLTALDAIIRRLDGRTININVDVDGAAAAAQIAAIETALVGVRASLGTIRSGGGAFGRNSALISGAAQFVLLMVQAGALALALSVAGAAVTAAWGAASTAILAIPPALMLLAAPIAAVATGMDGIKRAAQTIKPEFDRMRSAVAATFERHMVPVFRTLTGLLPTLTTGLQNSARALSFLAQSMANMLTSAPGLALISKTFENINFALLQMHPGLESVVQGFLLLGAQTSIFDALVKAVNTFGEEFRNSVIDVIADGTLDRAMSGLGESLAALSRGFASLVENGLRVFASAAPGVNKFLDSLTNFFNRFNWDRLGSAVGNVFRGLGETLDSIDTGTIREIEDAFVRLGDLFRDQKFKDDLKAMVDGLPAVIDQVRVFAKDFAALGAELSDALTAFNTVDQKFREFTSGMEESSKKLGQALNLHSEAGDGTGAFDWLRELDDDIDRALGILPPKAEKLGEDIGDRFQRGLDKIEPQFGGAIGDSWLPDIGKWLKDWFSPEDAGDLDTSLTDLETKIQDGMNRLGEITRQAMEVVKLNVQTGFAQIAPLATVGMLGIQTAISNGWLAIQAVTSLGMNTLLNTMTLGFVTLQTAAVNGMLLLQTAITTGFALVQLAVDLGILTMQTAIMNGFLQIQQDAINGMLLFTTAILTGFALAVPAVQLGMLQIVLAVQLGFQQIVAAVQTGMQQVAVALQQNWDIGVAATQAAMAAMAAAVQAGMAQITPAVQAGMANATSAVTSGVQQMASSMEAGMQRMVSAVQQGMDQVVDAIRVGIDDAIAQLRASEGLFYEAGANMGQALADGLRSKVNAVRSAAGELAAAAAAATAAAARIRSPSRVFIALGEQLGAGFAIGMRNSETEVERAARSMVATVTAGVAGIEDVFTGDAWAADLNARMNAELAAHDIDPTSAAGAGQRVVEIVQNFNVPSAERASDKASHGMRRLGAMGLFGG